MRITFNRAKREKTLAERGLDFRRAKEVFAGLHLTRIDDRRDYGELRFISAGKLDERIVIVTWTPRGVARRVISMRKANEREIKRLAPHLA
ncbi:MAG: BrnT family toxin [Steroidobacteraceae bacterium]